MGHVIKHQLHKPNAAKMVAYRNPLIWKARDLCNMQFHVPLKNGAHVRQKQKQMSHNWVDFYSTFESEFSKFRGLANSYL